MESFERGAPNLRAVSPETALLGPDGEPWRAQTVSAFWSWAFSDLLANTTRGQLAEFIVGVALDALPPVANRWESFDLQMPDGTRVEVKSAGLRQSWHQERASRARFSVRSAIPWDAATNAWGTDRGRNSDVYVFALHEETSLERADPLDLRQWSFRVLATAELDRAVGGQKTITLGRLAELANESGNVDDLRTLVAHALDVT